MPRSFKGYRKRARHDRYVAYFRSLVPSNLPSARKLLDVWSKRVWGACTSVAPPVPSFIAYLFSLWFKLVYYFYVTLPLATMTFLWSLMITFLYFWSRNSPLVKQFLIHASAIVDVLVNIGNVLANTSISVLAVDGIQMLMDMLTSFLDWRVSEANSQAIDVPSMTFAELNDLLYYEELSDEEGGDVLYERLGGKGVIGFGSGAGAAPGTSPSKQNMRRKMKQHMHQYIPPHTFRATIRVKSESGAGATSSTETSVMGSASSRSAQAQSDSTGSRQGHSPLLCPSEDEEEIERESRSQQASRRASDARGRGQVLRGDSDASVGVEGGGGSVQDIASPMSFPATPHSRARVMNKNAERVISTIFSARDILRMELLSTSSDETSRRAALEAKNNKKMAVFDPTQTSEGLSLTCGNHCLMKVGKGLCYSSRSMLALRRDMFIYYEFSVTASHMQAPVLSIGLSPALAPLGTMVGSSAMSFGVRSDGRLLVRSIWHSPAELHAFSPGSTVGFLVYMGSGDGDGGGGAVSTPPASASTRAGTVSPERGLERPNEEDGEEEGEGARQAHALGSSSSTSGTPRASVTINVDGSVLRLDDRANAALESVLLESLRGDVPLFPAVSILSPQVRVWCRFCEADILLHNPAAIGAPKQTAGAGSTNIYCLDGSRL